MKDVIIRTINRERRNRISSEDNVVGHDGNVKLIHCGWTDVAAERCQEFNPIVGW